MVLLVVLNLIVVKKGVWYIGVTADKSESFALLWIVVRPTFVLVILYKISVLSCSLAAGAA